MNELRKGAVFLCMSLLFVRAGLAQDSTAAAAGKMVVASCQFPVSSGIQDNAQWIRSQMKKAKDGGADVAHFPECALSGYGGADYTTLEGFDWDGLKLETTGIMRLADSLDLWVILGSVHRLGGTNRPHNSLYVIQPDGTILDRYDKRFCTEGDLKYYSPGDHLVIFEINGIRCGLLICYDVRFPELYRAYAAENVQFLFQSFYNARKKQPGIHPVIMPISAQAHAAANYFFISLSNSSAAESWPCHLILPNGLISGKLSLNEPGVLVTGIDTHEKYYDASRAHRLDAINGKLNSGETVSDPRSEDRTCY